MPWMRRIKSEKDMGTSVTSPDSSADISANRSPQPLSEREMEKRIQALTFLLEFEKDKFSRGNLREDLDACALTQLRDKYDDGVAQVTLTETARIFVKNAIQKFVERHADPEEWSNVLSGSRRVAYVTLQQFLQKDIYASRVTLPEAIHVEQELQKTSSSKGPTAAMEPLAEEEIGKRIVLLKSILRPGTYDFPGDLNAMFAETAENLLKTKYNKGATTDIITPYLVQATIDDTMRSYVTAYGEENAWNDIVCDSRKHIYRGLQQFLDMQITHSPAPYIETLSDKRDKISPAESQR